MSSVEQNRAVPSDVGGTVNYLHPEEILMFFCFKDLQGLLCVTAGVTVVTQHVNRHGACPLGT